MLLLSAPAHVLAQQSAWVANDDEIITDRPDVAESPRTVGAKRFQVEAGVDVAGVTGESQLFAPTKLRAGINGWTELHLESDVLSWRSQEGAASVLGRADLDVGIKVQLPTLPYDVVAGVLIALTLPVGADGTSDEAWLVSPTLALDVPLSTRFALGVNLGVTSAPGQTQEHVVRWAAAIGWDASALYEDLGLYMEAFGERAFDSDAQASLLLDGGFAFCITPWLQLDAYARVGALNADELGFGTGVSFKL